MFMNLAHRGASSYAPENTLAAFYKAIEVGANGIELDLRASNDGMIVIIHDATVDRTTDHTGLVADFTWEQLKKLDAGTWFSPIYAGERLITFQEFLHYFGKKPLFFAIELKDKGLDKEVCRLIHEYRLVDRCTITSFDFDILRAVREVDQKVNIGYLTEKIDGQTIEKIHSIQGQQICPKAEAISGTDVISAKEHGLSVRAWGVRDEAIMEYAYKCGVDGMTINFPDKLKAIIDHS